MKKKLLITLTTVCIVAIGGVTVYAGDLIGKDFTCPNCGAEIEMPSRLFGKKVGRGSTMGFKTLEELTEELTTKVEAGEITQEEMDEKIAEFEKKQEEMECNRAEIEEKIANGEIVPSGEREVSEGTVKGATGGKSQRMRGGHLAGESGERPAPPDFGESTN